MRKIASQAFDKAKLISKIRTNHRSVRIVAVNITPELFGFKGTTLQPANSALFTIDPIVSAKREHALELTSIYDAERRTTKEPNGSDTVPNFLFELKESSQFVRVVRFGSTDLSFPHFTLLQEFGPSISRH